MEPLSLTYAIADQDFRRTKSLGILHVSLELMARLAARREIARLHVLCNSGLEPHVPAAPHVTSSRHDEAVQGRVQRIMWDQIGVYRAAAGSGHRVLFLPKGFASFLRAPRMPLVAYVHDTMIQYYERHYPDAFGRLERTYFDACLRATVRHATLILTNSAFTASELGRAAAAWGCRLPPTVPVGIGVTPQPPADPVKSGRIMVLASRFPHKRTPLAIEYLARWEEATGFDSGVDWVGALPDRVMLPPRPRWRLHARVSDAEYAALLRSAAALVYFTDYEGFGMPPVEALAAGTAPVYSAIPATLEVMEGAGCPFATASFESFAAAMSRALCVDRRQLALWASTLLARHDWDRVTARVVAAMQHSCAG